MKQIGEILRKSSILNTIIERNCKEIKELQARKARLEKQLDEKQTLIDSLCQNIARNFRNEDDETDSLLPEEETFAPCGGCKKVDATCRAVNCFRK
jgi:hypothetical protein